MSVEPIPGGDRAGDDPPTTGVAVPPVAGTGEGRGWPGIGSCRPRPPRPVPGPSGRDPTGTAPRVGGRLRAGTAAGTDERSGPDGIGPGGFAGRVGPTRIPNREGYRPAPAR